MNHSNPNPIRSQNSASYSKTSKIRSGGLPYVASSVLAITIIIGVSFGSSTRVGAGASATLTVDPTAGLVDGQRVTVEGEGYLPSAPIIVVQCRSDVGATGMGACETFGGPPSLASDADGRISGNDFEIAAVLHTTDGVTDCRVDQCVIATFNPLPPVLAAVADTDFDPAGQLLPAPQLVVNPNVALHDGQRLEVTGTGFRTGVDLQLQQCLLTATFSSEDCSTLGRLLSASPTDGSFETGHSVDRLLETPAGRFDCAVHECGLVVTYVDQLFVLAAQSLSFGSSDTPNTPDEPSIPAVPLNRAPEFTG